MFSITLNEPPAHGAWSLEQQPEKLNIHDKFVKTTNANSYTSSLQRDSRNVWSPTSDTINIPLTNGTTGTVYNALSGCPTVNGEVNGGCVGREDTSSASRPTAHRRSTASSTNQPTATTASRTRDIIILSDPEGTCQLYTCSTDIRSNTGIVAADLQDCFGLDAQQCVVGISSLLRRLGLETEKIAADDTIGHFVSDNRKRGLPYLTLQLELLKNVEIDDYELGINQEEQAQELLQTLREQIGNHWSNIQFLASLRNDCDHYELMVLLQNSVLSIGTPDAENMIDDLIRVLCSSSVPLSRDGRAWKMRRLGTSLHDYNNQGGHTVEIALAQVRGGVRADHDLLIFKVSQQSDVVVARTVARFIGYLFSGFTGDGWSKPGLLQYYPSADVVRIVVGLLNRDREEGEFELMF